MTLLFKLIIFIWFFNHISIFFYYFLLRPRPKTNLHGTLLGIRIFNCLLLILEYNRFELHESTDIEIFFKKYVLWYHSVQGWLNQWMWNLRHWEPTINYTQILNFTGVAVLNTWVFQGPNRPIQKPLCHISYQFSSVAQSCLTLWPHGLQQARLPCPSPIPRACSNSCPSSWWCHPTVSSCHPLLLLLLIHSIAT